MIVGMSGDNRRQSRRSTVPLDGAWEGAAGHRVGRIGDISVGGCYVESMSMPTVGERISVRATLPGGGAFEAVGEVAYVAMGMGFGVRFLDLTAAQSDALVDAMRQLA